MLDTKEFGHLLHSYGFDFYSGVPCSFLKNLINYAINECYYIAAANEGDAIAVCAGAHLGGRKAVFLCQNSGLTNATSPLISLNNPYRLPVLGFVSLRGDPALQDEPQHALMGKITPQLLTEMEIAWEYLAENIEEAKAQLARANQTIEKNASFFFIVRKDTFSPLSLKKPAPKAKTTPKYTTASLPDELPTRRDVLALLAKEKTPDTLLLATTGYTSRELYEIDDNAHNFYMVGSMGCVSAIGLGLALTQPQKKVIAIDGDGALLMRLGNMATNAHYQPENLLHLLLDNGLHESTGGQATVSPQIDFTTLANAIGYPQSIYVHSLEELRKAYQSWLQKPLLTFIVIKTAAGIASKELARPTLQPWQVKDRFMRLVDTAK